MEDLRDHDSAQFSEMAFAMMLHIIFVVIATKRN